MTGVSGNVVLQIAAVPKAQASEVAATLPGVGLDGLLIIPTCQHSEQDLVRVGESIEQEKDLLLEKFMAFATTVCEDLQAKGHWADYLDPCSGLTMMHPSNGSVYSEVEAFSTLLNYKTANAGCCKKTHSAICHCNSGAGAGSGQTWIWVLLHPEWGTFVYPASLFLKAPLAEAVSAIEAANATLVSNKSTSK